MASKAAGKPMFVEAMSPMEKIPDEVLLLIFLKLPLSDLILSARLTCWRWHHLSRDSTLWRDVDLSVFKCGYDHTDKKKNSAGVKTLLYNIQESLERLTFSNLSVDGGVYELFGSSKHKHKVKFTNLKRLDYSYSAVSARNLRVALTANPDIEELVLSYTNIYFSQVLEEAVHLSNLRTLIFHDLHSWDSFLDHHQQDQRLIIKLAAMMVPKHCPLLEVVELHTIWTILDDDVIQQFTKYCPKLRKLSFTWSANITENAFANLSSKTHQIRELVLANRQARRPYLKFVLPYFPLLLRLIVSGHNVYLEDCVALGLCCPELEELVFEMQNEGEGSRMFEFLGRRNALCGLELSTIAHHCVNLRKVHVPYSDIDDVSVRCLSLHCRFLEDVNFTHCHRLTKESIKSLAKYSAYLKKVNYLENNIDHYYLLSLLAKRYKLEEVIFDSKSEAVDSASHPEIVGCEISDYTDLDDASSEEGAAGSISGNVIDDIPFIDMTTSADDFDLQCSLLQNLSKNTSSVLEKDVPFRTVASTLPKHFMVNPSHCHLRKLSLKNSPAPGDCLESIFKECPDLTHVMLDGCANLSDNVSITLVKSCPSLKTLNISPKMNSGSGMFGDSALVELTRHSYNLESLSILYNKNITPFGLSSVFHALDSTLRSLQSLSLCVGQGYACPISAVTQHGLKHLTQHSKRRLKETAAITTSRSFTMLHLEYQRRKR